MKQATGYNTWQQRKDARDRDMEIDRREREIGKCLSCSRQVRLRLDGRWSDCDCVRGAKG